MIRPAPSISGRRAANAIPSFSLYGESAVPGQEVLHIEAVASRSRLYQWEIEPHVHHGLYQVLWLGSGAAEVVLDESATSVQGPAAIVVPPGVVHGFRFSPGTDGRVLTFSARLLVEGEFLSVGQAFRALFSSPGVLTFLPQDSTAERLDALFRELGAEFNLLGTTESPVAGWLARAVVWRLAQARALVSQSPGARASRYQALFTRFLLLVEQQFLAHWPLERYASHLGLSTQRLNRLARAESGRSALALVHARLVREACRRLVYTAAPAASLAAELGFDDPAYFSRFFKRHTGLSPQRYRLAHRAQEGLTPPEVGA